METPEQETTSTSTAKKADIGKRIVAAIIDAVAAGFVGIILNLVLWGTLVGSMVAAAYWLLRDGLNFEFMKGRSLGKKLMGLTLVRADGGEMDVNASIRRNWILAVPGLLSALVSGASSLALVPLVTLLSFAGFAVFVFETYKFSRILKDVVGVILRPAPQLSMHPLSLSSM